ncbi:MAG: pantoate--beta-alanine ligase [Myxococcota bacterium]|nr:pantoate--beta-alanine ligase [Myxococcota bacterium]
MTRVVHDKQEFRAACDSVRADGGRLGLVPTMGALHEGHLALADEARRRGASCVALTIFVNPLQFGPSEDFDRYPRTLESDVERCRASGVELVWAPARDSMYPVGFQSEVVVGDLTKRLEGAHRPGHFAGVTTVVTKLFQVAGPCVAAFGRKDYQQWKVIERMARDLDMPIEVVGMPTVREHDGLAKSSRNRYLSDDERARALGIARGLRAAHVAFDGGERDPARIAALVRGSIEACSDAIDYVDVADPETLEPFDAALGDRAVITVAARIGATRLIDNTVLGEDRAP